MYSSILTLVFNFLNMQIMQGKLKYFWSNFFQKTKKKS